MPMLRTSAWTDCLAGYRVPKRASVESYMVLLPAIIALFEFSARESRAFVAFASTGSQPAASGTHFGAAAGSSAVAAAAAKPVPQHAGSPFSLLSASSFVACGLVASAVHAKRQQQQKRLHKRGPVPITLVARQAGVSKKWTSDEDRIVITGMGLVSAFGTDVETYHESLCAGKSAIKMVEGFSTEGWPTRFAGQIGELDYQGYIPPKSARRLDPFLKYGILSGKKCLEHAGIAIDSDAFNSLDKSRCGIIYGSGMGGIQVINTSTIALSKGGPKKVSPFFIPYAITNMASGMLAIDTGFMACNYSISTACATANFCYISAAKDIRDGQADLILAGGVEAPVNELGLAGFVACRALSQNNEDPEGASRPWDKTRDGFVLGEGAGVLCMERLSHAKARGAPILAEYLGGARTCDAHHMTEPRGDGLGVSSCITGALEDAGVDKKQVSYVNAHATSTPAGDITEIRAVKKAFDNDTDHLVMNGTKSMVGHGLGAAGGLEAVACIQAIRHKKVHPTINVTDPDPEMDIKAPFMKDGAMDLDIEVAISNSFGFGGHNGVVAFAPYVP